MSSVLQIAAYAFVIIGAVVPATFLSLSKAPQIDTQAEVLLCLFGFGCLAAALVLFGLGVGMQEVERLRGTVEGSLESMSSFGGSAPAASPRASTPKEREDLERLEAKQAMDAVKTYIDLEMWVLALQKAEDLTQKFPKSPEAEKVRKNIDQIRKRVEETRVPAGAKAPAPAAPAPSGGPSGSGAAAAIAKMAPKVLAAAPRPVPAKPAPKPAAPEKKAEPAPAPATPAAESKPADAAPAATPAAEAKKEEAPKPPEAPSTPAPAP
ncbi:MAG: hypothetical protein HYZ53_17795 [Planctomycetes bacterium]|nr:hypothetical protein [Planctomycetota bacterium]